MKKSLIALAVLAASGAAMAQSSVTVYGRVDASVGSTKQGTVGAVTSNSQLYSGNLTTSRLGFRGTEDLGGGLRAIFGLETGLAIDAPAATTLGDRAAFVGLQGGFGTVRLGRHDTSFDDIRDVMVVHNLWDSQFSSTRSGVTGTGINAVGGLNDYNDRANNQIRYDSPSFGGVTLGVSYGMDEDSTVSQDVVAYNIRYRAGKLDAGIAFQENRQAGAPGYAITNNIDYTTIAAAYNFGSFRVSGGWNQVKNKVAGGRKANSYSIGVMVPVGAWEFSAGYTTAESKAVGNGLGANAKEEGSTFALGATYALSKRTRLYAAYNDGDIERAGVTNRERRLYSVGVRHDF